MKQGTRRVVYDGQLRLAASVLILGGTFYLAHRGGYGSHFGGTAFVPAQGRDGKKKSLKALAPWLRSAGNVL